MANPPSTTPGKPNGSVRAAMFSTGGKTPGKKVGHALFVTH